MRLKTIIIIMLLLGASTSWAQNATITAGGEATGSGGSQNYSLGQLLYIWEESSSSKINGLGVQQSYINLWEGYSNSNWGLSSNWLLNTVPSEGENIILDMNPYNPLLLDQNRSVGNIINSQSTYRALLNGYKLTLNGLLIFSNGAELDASATGSTLSFAGTTTQNLLSTTLSNQQIYNLNINNSNNVILSGSLNIQNEISSTTGRLDAYTQSPTLVYGGSEAQTLHPNILLDERIYNLTSDNSAGLTINNSLTIDHNLTINISKLLTIASDKSMTVNGILTNNAGSKGFVLSSSATGTASLIHNTDNVAVTAQRYIDGTASAWHFLSSPITSQLIKSTEWTPAGTYGDGTGYDLYVWDEPASCWIYNLNTTVTPTWSTVHPSDSFVPGLGYLYALQSTTPTNHFVGNLNNGVINQPVLKNSTGTYAGFNLLGNPYPSSIDWKNDNGFNRSMLVSSGGGYDIWIWNNAADNYGVYNSAMSSNTGTNDVSRYISPEQGFFVRAASAGTFSFNNAGRVHTGASMWMKASSEQSALDKIRVIVNAVGTKGQDEVVAYLGFPSIEDGASKVFSTIKTAPSLYLPVGKENLSIRYLSDTYQTSSLPINFKSGKSGTYTMEISIPDTIQSAILEDKLTGTMLDLTQCHTYKFESSTNDAATRFMIHFEIQNNTTQTPLVYVSNDKLVIDGRMTSNYQSSIFDATGRTLYTDSHSTGNTTEYQLRTKGVYLVVISTNESHKSVKVVY